MTTVTKKSQVALRSASDYGLGSGDGGAVLYLVVGQIFFKIPVLGGPLLLLGKGVDACILLPLSVLARW